MRNRRAFTRLDLVVSVGVVLLLGTWLGFARLGERGLIIQCQSHLSALGKAMHEYAAENKDALPAAEINYNATNNVSWDSKLFPYLDSGSAKSTDSSQRHALLLAAAPHLVCPSDSAVHKARPRSYAMAGNDMVPEHWPPGSAAATGVGLVWNERTMKSLLSVKELPPPASLPTIKMSDVPAPADTLLITELINPANLLGGSQHATVAGITEQEQFFTDGVSQFHQGRFNYLMVDGHVEALSPLQTGAFDGSAGIWTLKKGE